MKKVAVLNCGSSSIKYETFDMGTDSMLAAGLLEKIGESGSRLKHRVQGISGGYEELVRTEKVSDHNEGFRLILDTDPTVLNAGELFGIGHRVVHGGEFFREPALIDDEVIRRVGQMIPLAPLHNTANLTGIEVAMRICPGVPQVAVFDTAFHQTLPPHAFHYALPQEFYRAYHVRRYGFHGTSHQFVSRKASELLGKRSDELNLITLHLGNGASSAAIRGGKSIDTSMGMTPLEGLVMGTRCGDLDPAVPFYLAGATGKKYDEIEAILNHESGLKGICGAKDMREVHSLADAGDTGAQLALDLFCYRIRKYIGAYFAVLGRVDAIVFTGGIGENAPYIRRKSCDALEHLGISIDTAKNMLAVQAAGEIHADGASVKILVIPTNEELEIARQTVECIGKCRQK